MGTIWIYSLNLGIVALMMVIGWLVSLKLENVTVVDSLWAVGFMLIAWSSLMLGPGGTLRSLLLVLMTTAWGLRLSGYLSWRNWGKGEDPRYGAWRARHGEHFGKLSLYKVFLLQAVFLWVIALSLQYGILGSVPAGLTWLDALGIVTWIIGFGFEAIGDYQLARFKADPANKGRVMDKGLWAYTRHPNYFGEAMVWWGVALMVLSVPGSWWTLISPIIITAVLLKMTGVTLTERHLVDNKPQYRDYMQRTSSFIPWPPKRRR